jgi:hypothetical protein
MSSYERDHVTAVNNVLSIHSIAVSARYTSAEIHPPPRQAPAMTSRSAGHPRPVHGAARRPSPPHASVSTRGWCRQMGHRSSLPLPAQPARHAPAATHNAPNQATPSTSIARPDEGQACRQRLLLPEVHIRGQERRGEGADSTTLPHAPAPSPSATHTAEEESESTWRRAPPRPDAAC